MTTRMTSAVLIASLAIALIVPLGGANLAFGEVSDEIKYKALEGKHVWEKLDYIKDKAYKTDNDKKQEKELQKQFDAIVKEMNKHGIASPEQWKKDPDYWRDANLPPLPDVHTTPIGADGINMAAPGSNIELMGPCYCPQKLNMIAGFDYRVWGWWWSSGYDPWGWGSGTFEGDVITSDVMTSEIHSRVTPHLTVNI